MWLGSIASYSAFRYFLNERVCLYVRDVQKCQRLITTVGIWAKTTANNKRLEYFCFIYFYSHAVPGCGRADGTCPEGITTRSITVQLCCFVHRPVLPLSTVRFVHGADRTFKQIVSLLTRCIGLAGKPLSANSVIEMLWYFALIILVRTT